MDIKETYDKAVEHYNAKEYDSALKLLDDIKKTLNEFCRKTYSLEASSLHRRNDFITEYYALKKILPFLDLSSPEGKKFAADAFFRLANVCLRIFLSYFSSCNKAK